MPNMIMTPTGVPATAKCPKCGNTVYNDRLSADAFKMDPATGEDRPTRLVIDCETCDQVSTVRITRL